MTHTNTINPRPESAAETDAAGRRPKRGRFARRTALVLALLVTAGSALAVLAPNASASSGWTRYNTDHVVKSSSNNKAHVSGYVDWYKSWRHPLSIFGHVNRGTKVWADSGCAIVNVSWKTLTGGVGVGPVSGSISGANQSATAVACNGQKIDLGGVERVARDTLGVTFEVCWASNRNSIAKYCRADTAWS